MFVCCGGTRSKVTGSVAGNSLVARDAYASLFDGRTLEILIGDHPRLCEDNREGKIAASSTRLEIFVSDRNGFTPGNYEIGAQPEPYAAVNFTKRDASCESELKRATSGMVSLHSVTLNHVTGTFDVMFDDQHLTGSIDVDVLGCEWTNDKIQDAKLRCQ